MSVLFAVLLVAQIEAPLPDRTQITKDLGDAGVRLNPGFLDKFQYHREGDVLRIQFRVFVVSRTSPLGIREFVWDRVICYYQIDAEGEWVFYGYRR